MKKIICIVIAVIAVAALYFALSNKQEVFPYAFAENTPEVIPVSSKMPINLEFFRQYQNESVTINIYKAENFEYGGESVYEDTYSAIFDKKGDSINEITYLWDTPAEPGNYIVEYYTGYLDSDGWHESDEKLYTSFKTVFPCDEHDFVQNEHSIFGHEGVKSDCYTNGTAYNLCHKCGYEEEAILELSHVYDTGKSISAATCSSIGYKTYSCKNCGANKVEVLEIDPERHNIRAVEKIAATLTRPGSVWFKCSYCTYVEPYETEIPALFMEIEPGIYYEEPVIWAHGKDAFNSIRGYEFNPEDNCTKAQTISLMYILNGVGVTKEDENPFVDVEDGDFFRDAAKWAYKYGVVEGEEFNPEDNCTRAMIVEYLWKMKGSPRVRAVHDFADIPEGASYSNAVSWAVSKGIASGIDEATFNPDGECTQAQVITFLYRTLYDAEAEAAEQAEEAEETEE